MGSWGSGQELLTLYSILSGFSDFFRRVGVEIHLPDHLKTKRPRFPRIQGQGGWGGYGRVSHFSWPREPGKWRALEGAWIGEQGTRADKDVYDAQGKECLKVKSSKAQIDLHM